ncbi:hypothetical protein [Nonomuraea endophytica]|uniref:hypothetical protein n=1 Tax=Nonomuraea endophytica TaxID=714136 RepID=UPI0037C8E6CC
MSVVIGEVLSEVVLSTGSATSPDSAGADGPDDALVERIVRQATERVLERLRREWEG